MSAASLTVPAGTFPPLIARRVASLSVAAPYAVPDKGSQSGVIRLVSGAPAPEALPLNDFARSAAAVFGSTKTGTAALAYGPHAGLPALRSWIGEREGVDASSVLVTNGALHGVALAFGALIEPDDVVVLDDPVFPDTVRIAEQFGARVLPVKVGPTGIDVQQIADHLAGGVRIKLVYTVADFHNPSGGVLPAADRAQLVELAQRYRVEGAGLPDGEYLRSRGDPDESAVGIRRRGDEASYHGAVTVAVEQAGAVFDVVAAIDQSADKPGMRLHPAVDDGDSLVASGCVLLGLPDPQPPLRWRLDLEVLRVVRDRLLAGCLLLDRTRLPGGRVVHDVGHGGHAGRRWQRRRIHGGWHSWWTITGLGSHRPRRSCEAQQCDGDGDQRGATRTETGGCPHSARKVL